MKFTEFYTELQWIFINLSITNNKNHINELIQNNLIEYVASMLNHP
jgi:hypothetical protein